MYFVYQHNKFYFWCRKVYTNKSNTLELKAVINWQQNHPESLRTRYENDFKLECAQFLWKLTKWNLKMNSLAKLKVWQWAQSFLQPMQLYRWGTLKSTFLLFVIKNTDNHWLITLRKTLTLTASSWKS